MRNPNSGLSRPLRRERHRTWRGEKRDNNAVPEQETYVEILAGMKAKERRARTVNRFNISAADNWVPMRNESGLDSLREIDPQDNRANAKRIENGIKLWSRLARCPARLFTRLRSKVSILCGLQAPPGLVDRMGVESVYRLRRPGTGDFMH